MEGLLILAGIYLLDVVIKKMAASKKKQQEQRREVPPTDELDSREDQQSPPRKGGSLQDLIRQFEEAQRQATQGGHVEPVPPPEDLDDEEPEDLPVVRPAKPGQYTFQEIAESVVQWEVVSVDLLMQAFGFNERIATRVLADLQAKRIVGRDMGDGDCDLLVHDKTELNNLFKRLKQEEEELRAKQMQEAELKKRREAEAKHQQELAELEERARLAREQASQQETLPEADEATPTPCLASSSHKGHSRSFNKAEIRRGFVWAKVLDEPRFKKHWSTRQR